MNISKNQQPVKPLTSNSSSALPRASSLWGFSHADVIEYEGFDGRYGLPDQVRRALVACGLSRCVRVYEALWMCGMDDTLWLSAKAVGALLAHRGIPISMSTCRRALTSTLFEVRVVPITAHQRGAPFKEYRLRPMRAVCLKTGLDPGFIDLHTTPFSVDDLHSARAYKMRVCIATACYYGEISFSRLASQLNVSTRTIIRWTRIYPDVEITRQYQRQDLSLFENSLELVAQFEAKNRESGRQRYYVEAVTWHEEAPHDRVKAYPCIVAAVRRAEKAGARLVLVTCLPNRYRPREDLDAIHRYAGCFLPY
jgi:hypothetical protein